jgi:hypothetical protein
MKRVRLMHVLAGTLLAVACGESAPTEVDTRPLVRFVNATTGMTGSGGFTANSQFAAGSALPSGQATQTCSRLTAGATSFGFGAANAGGTALSGNALVSENQTLAAGGSYTVVATGTATSPVMLIFTNSFSGDLGANQAAVRFANFAPNTGTTVYNYVFYKGAVGTTILATNLPFGAASTYSLVTSGANTFSAIQIPGHTTVIESSSATLEAGSVNTMALVMSASGGFQLMHLPRCS